MYLAIYVFTYTCARPDSWRCAAPRVLSLSLSLYIYI